MNRTEQTILPLFKIIECNLSNPLDLLNRGNAYLDQGKYDNAIKDYTEAISYYPNFAEAYNNRGVAFYKKGKYDRAIQDYNQAIHIQPDYALAYNNRVNAYQKKVDQHLAIQQ